MNTQQKAEFVQALSGRIVAELVADIKADKLPEHWDGIELRALLAERFERSKMGREGDHRHWRAYRNEVITRNL